MSNRRDSDVPYDLSLLSGVPDPTLEGKQLEDRPAHFPRATNRLSTAWQQGKLEDVPEHPVANMSWYRTRWGITAIVVAIVLIVGVTVGGAVGGTHHSSHKTSSNTNNSNSPSQSNPSPSPSPRTTDPRSINVNTDSQLQNYPTHFGGPTSTGSS